MVVVHKSNGMCAIGMYCACIYGVMLCNQCIAMFTNHSMCNFAFRIIVIPQYAGSSPNIPSVRLNIIVCAHKYFIYKKIYTWIVKYD